MNKKTFLIFILIEFNVLIPKINLGKVDSTEVKKKIFLHILKCPCPIESTILKCFLLKEFNDHKSNKKLSKQDKSFGFDL